MSNIKIKQTAETVIKTSENIGIVNEKIKDVGVRTKEKINNATKQTNSNSPEQYAVEKVQKKQKTAQIMPSMNLTARAEKVLRKQRKILKPQK